MVREVPWLYIMALWGRPQEVTVGRPQDVKFQRAKDVGRGRLQDVDRELPWGYIEDHIGTSIRCLLGTSSERPGEVIFSEWVVTNLHDKTEYVIYVCVYIYVCFILI